MLNECEASRPDWENGGNGIPSYSCKCMPAEIFHPLCSFNMTLVHTVMQNEINREAFPEGRHLGRIRKMT